MRHLYSGRALAALGRPGDSAAAYADARSAGSGNPDAEADIAAYLLLAGEEDLFRQTLRESLTTVSPFEPFFQKIVSTARQLGDTRRLHDIYQSVASHPDLAVNPSFQNDLVLLDLLLGGQADLSTTALRLEANPNDFSMRTTHALAILQAGSPNEALEILSGGERETRISELPAMHQAIAAAILAAAGRQREALQIANAIPARSLGLQERELLARYISGQSQTN
jgi:thioredoxin-like negative regulator of GroEL